MADSKISALPALVQADVVPSSNVLPIVNASTTKKVTVDALVNAQLAQSTTTTGIGVAAPVLKFAVEKDNGSGYIGSFRNAPGSTYITVQTTGGITHLQGINAGFTDVADIGLQPSGGNVKLGNGNLVIGTSGKGIDFTQDPNPAGMTSELLDDYEEGTWTPTVGTNGGDGTYTVTVNSATYTKIGNLVRISFDLTVNVTVSPTGALFIGGLPYNAAENTAFADSLNTLTGATGNGYLVAGSAIMRFTPASSASWNDMVGGTGLKYVVVATVYRSA